MKILQKNTLSHDLGHKHEILQKFGHKKINPSNKKHVNIVEIIEEQIKPKLSPLEKH